MIKQINSEDIVGTLKELPKTVAPESEKWNGICLLAFELLYVSEDSTTKLIYDE